MSKFQSETKSDWWAKSLADRKNSFIKKANKIHLQFYNYDNVLYKNSRTKVNIICPKHGEFEQRPC